MRAVIQRVSRAQVSVGEEVVGKIGAGLLVLLGVATTDTAPDADYLAGKVVGLRIFAVRLPSRVAGLFVNSAAYGACVAINSQHPFERQRWRRAHEYAHFLAQRSHSEVTVLHGYRRYRQPSASPTRSPRTS